LIDEHTPDLVSEEDLRNSLLDGLYDYLNEGESQEDFVAALEAEYSALLEDDQIVTTFTSILETVPPVPDACEQEVLDAQADLIVIAEGIEALMS
jgi:hypothetical protein